VWLSADALVQVFMTGPTSSTDQTLQDYLDSLLQVEPPVEEKLASVKFAAASNIATLPAAPRPVRPAPVRPYAEPIRTLNLRLPPVVEPPPAAVDVPVAEKIVVAPIVEPVPETAAARVEPASTAPVIESLDAELSLEQMAAPAAWLANGRPSWAQQPFECLLFKSGGLTLAAPLVELGSIYPMEAGSLTTVFGQTSWFIGLLPVKEYNARAIDTAMVVMPERYQAAMRDAYRYLITLYGSDWGLAVDEVVNSVVLDPADVRWRGQRGKRPWLAGTVVEQMCALLDISQLAWMFHNQDRKRQRPEPA
jgi:purine-binding chemotaxis protein CheW